MVGSHLLFRLVILLGALLATTVVCAEDDAARHIRHQCVAQRRQAVHLICHRGACELAHENTLEAYRAAFELGADGNEIDVRATKDGVLVCFHDDMIDHLLVGYGDVADYTWDALRAIPFRNPGRFGQYCRIPTLREVLELHRDQAGLLHLDVKRPGLSESIAALLTEFDMWDHVVASSALFRDDRIHPTLSKASMYGDRSEVFADAIAETLAKPGLMIILENPRCVARALSREVQTPSDTPYSDRIASWAQSDGAPGDDRTLTELLAVISNATAGSDIPQGGSQEEATDAAKILARSRAADALLLHDDASPEVLAALESRVRSRTLHRDWRYCGLDGAAALRALIGLRAPRAVDVARFCLWRDDPAVEAYANPEFHNPRSWTDWRTKITVFSQLESIPGEATEQLCRDYLQLSDDQAREIGIPQFEQAARTLLCVSPKESTVDELLEHRLRVVRGRAVLYCLAHSEQLWTQAIVERYLPGT